MAKYRVRGEGGVYDTELELNIPDDPENGHYAKYLRWVTAGNITDPAPTPAPLTDAQLLDISDKQMIRAVDWLLQYLVTNGVIPMADIPPALKTLYLERKAQRGA